MPWLHNIVACLFYFILYFKNIILTFSTIHLTAFLKDVFIFGKRGE